MSGRWWKLGLPVTGRWWKVGLPVVVLAVIVIVVAIAGGDDDSEEPITSAQAPPEETLPDSPPGADATTPDEEPSENGDQGGQSGGGSAEQPTEAPATDGPNPFEGEPVGKVPKDGGPEDDQAAVVKALKSMLKSIARGNGFQACAQLTEEGQRAMERKLADIAPETAGAPCAASILLYQGGYGESIKNPKITNVSVAGSQATATGPLKQPAKLVKSGRLWLVSRYGNDY